MYKINIKIFNNNNNNINKGFLSLRHKKNSCSFHNLKQHSYVHTVHFQLSLLLNRGLLKFGFLSFNYLPRFPK